MRTPEKEPVVVDPRGVREIMLDVERYVLQAIQPKSAESKTRVVSYPTRPSAKAADAMRLVLEDWKHRGVRGGFGEFIAAVNDVEPGTFASHGQTNDVIRSFCAEYCGIDVRWAREQG